MSSEAFVAAMRAGAAAIRSADTVAGIAAYERATAIDPRAGDAWFNLAYLNRVARDFDAALEGYRRAIDADVARPEEAMLNRAAILSEQLGRADEARDELRRALAVAPRFATAWLNLGVLEEDAGALDAARDAYTAAAKVDPSNGRAIARLIALDIAAGRTAAGVDRAKRALTAPLPPVDRAEILLAEAAARDAMGDYAAAFAAARAGNGLLRDGLRAQGRGYDRGRQDRFVDAWLATPRSTASPRDGAPDLLFICGMFRSGSTLLEQLLARHSQIAACGELEAIPAIAASIPNYPRGLAALDDATLAQLREKYLAEACAAGGTARLLIDKRPDNFQHLGLIKALFPNARIVETQRDPRDILISSFFLAFADGVPYGFDLGDLAHWHRQYRRLMRHWHALYPADIHTVSYERLVSDPAAELRAAVDFLGLEWEPGVADTTPIDGVVRTASMWQVRKPINTASVERWRHYENELAPVLPLLEL